ncbi:MAG TPA: ATP-dependent DNA helicase [Dissulfurispiraceae bacterium]
MHRETELSRLSESFLRKTVGAAMEDYEFRSPQREMMEACCRTVEEGGTLLAEAGTGTGKTFAYLIPILLSGARAVISTRTINLQEQVVSKDLRFLSALSDFDYAIAKGRGNYLCMRRMNAFRANDDEEAEEYRRLLTWSAETKTGDVEEYGSFTRSNNSSGWSNWNRRVIWDRVCSDADACKGLQCGFHAQCFYFGARQSWERARIVVANHSLIGINALLDPEARLLPSAEVLVIDEAHALDHVLTEVAGITLSNKGFDYLLNKFLRLDERGAFRGLLAQSPHLFPAVEALRTDMGLLWVHAREGLKHRETIGKVFPLRERVVELSAAIRTLIEKIRTGTTGLFQEDDELEMKAALTKLRAFADGMEEFSEENRDNPPFPNATGNGGVSLFSSSVRWADFDENKTTLRKSPVYPRDFVAGSIVPEYRAVILTSATLSVAGDFGFFTNVLGLEGAERIAVPSPFDLREQVTVEIRRGINLKTTGSAERLANAIIGEAAKEDGGILVLFTSRDVMKRTWEASVDALSGMGLNPMLQGEMPNRMMLEIMRESDNSVIFGLDSFWEGVDVKGDALKCLIITKLPFEVPTEPIAKARAEDIDRRGGNSFYEYSLPRAVLKFKQGFGRLIRSRNDRGRVIICDDRIETRAYGRKFLESIY